MPRSYVGIGARVTPERVLGVMESIAGMLAIRGFILRSGGADGADSAFERGCDTTNGQKEIYLPWKDFNDHDSELVVNKPLAFQIAEEFHPAWRAVKQGGRKLHARNAHQVLGWNLNEPAEFVICWTEHGAFRGGTAQALRMAQHFDIPIYNLGTTEGHNTTLQHMAYICDGLG